MTTITDNFAANNSPLAAPWSKDTSPSGWSSSGGTANPNSTGGDEDGIYNGAGAPAWGNDQSISANVTASATGNGNGIGFWVRHATGATTGYRFVTNHDASNNCALRKAVAGSFSTLVNWTTSWTDGDLWELRVIGTTITVYLNGTQVQSATDSAITSGSPGIASSSPITSGFIDNVTITDSFATGPSPRSFNAIPFIGGIL
jgi:hypothetical protein